MAMDLDKQRPSSSTGFHSAHRAALPTYRRADSFADLDSLHNRHVTVLAPKPVKARRTMSAMGASSGAGTPAPRSTSASPLGERAMQRMLSVDDEHFLAYEELHEILFSGSDSDSLAGSDSVMCGSPASPAGMFRISSPTEIPRPGGRYMDPLHLASPPSRAPNPCSQNRHFRADGVELGLLSPSPPASMHPDERRFQHAY